MLARKKSALIDIGKHRMKAHAAAPAHAARARFFCIEMIVPRYARDDLAVLRYPEAL